MKWIQTTDQKPNNKSDFFRHFKHTSPFILQLFDQINQIQIKKKIPEQEKIVIVKYAKLIHVFTFNDINSLLISRVKGAHLLMNCLISYTHDLTTEENWT